MLPEIISPMSEVTSPGLSPVKQDNKFTMKAMLIKNKNKFIDLVEQTPFTEQNVEDIDSPTKVKKDT